MPKLTLDELFEKKDEIALEVEKQVAEEMSTYGYIIVKTLITKVEPDAEVKQSMNEINAAQRKRRQSHERAALCDSTAGADKYRNVFLSTGAS